MEYYVLQSEAGTDAETLYEPAEPMRLGPAPTCPRCGRYVGLRTWLAPRSARIGVYGRVFGDVAFGSGTDLLLSDSFVSAWRSKSLRGLGGFEPVAVRRTSAPRLSRSCAPKYFHATAGRTNARVNRATSQIETAGTIACELCLGPGPIDGIAKLDIDLRSVGEEDAFQPWGAAGIVVVSERVLALAEEHRLENVTGTPLSTFSWDPLGRRAPPKK